MNDQSPVIQCKVTIPAALESVWDVWTKREGIISFLAPECDIEAKAGGKFEIYFMPEANPGERGSEGCVILALQPKSFLSFTWNAPPHLPEIRKQRTHVSIRLKGNGEETSVFLSHDGWGCGDEWDQAFNYFESAWLNIVLPRLKYRFVQGSIDWAHPPGPEALSECK